MTEAAQPQEPQKTKAELFAEDPDRFIDATEVLMVVGRDPSKGLMLLNRCMTMADCRDVKFDVEQAIADRVLLIKMEAAKNKSKIVVAKNGSMGGKLMDHLRGKH